MFFLNTDDFKEELYSISSIYLTQTFILNVNILVPPRVSLEYGHNEYLWYTIIPQIFIDFAKYQYDINRTNFGL